TALTQTSCVKGGTHSGKHHAVVASAGAQRGISEQSIAVIEPVAAEHVAAHGIVRSRGGGIVFTDMRRALEPGAACPLKSGREALGRALIFGPVEAEAHDPFMRMREDIVEHALGSPSRRRRRPPTRPA